MSDSNEMSVDVLVIGAGMGGLSAAAYAARHGASVIVVEKAAKVGGSALLSGGGLWTTSSFEAYRQLDTRSDQDLIQLLVDHFQEGADFVASLGVDIAQPMPLDRIQGYPSVARVFDNLGYIQRCQAAVIEAGGWVVTQADTKRLLIEDGRVVGAVVEDRDGETSLKAAWTVLATGGFQGSPELCSELTGKHAAGLPLRANPTSDGCGLRLARAAGAALNVATESFYGHLVPFPLPATYGPGDFVRLAQIYSPQGILFDSDGRRFVDESKAYYGNAVAVSRQPDRRALLFADEVVRDTDRTMYGRNTESVDRPLEAQRAGGRVVIADTMEEIDRGVKEWGYSGISEAVQRYNDSIDRAPDLLDPPRQGRRSQYRTAPFFAMEVQPAITFSFGGLRADAHARVLDNDGHPIAGLLAAGVDIGVYHTVYAGGLAFGLVTGLTAAKTALGR